MDVKSKGALPRLVAVPTACSLPLQSELQSERGRAIYRQSLVTPVLTVSKLRYLEVPILVKCKFWALHRPPENKQCQPRSDQYPKTGSLGSKSRRPRHAHLDYCTSEVTLISAQLW